MKKSLSLKLIVFSLFLVVASISYSAAPVFQGGTGTNSTEAGVDNTASKENSSAFGYDNTASGTWSSAFGSINIASGRGSSAFGIQNTASEESSSAFGYLNTASGRNSSAFGYENKANGFSSLAFGYKNTASGKESSAFGYKNTASGTWSSAFGNWNMVGKLKDDGSGNFIPDENFGKNSLALGSEYQVTGNYSGTFGVGLLSGGYQYVNEGNDSYMIGNKNKIASGSNDNFILGNNVEIGAGVQKSVVLGDGSASGGSNTVSVGSSALQRKIVNVGEGEISATSTDAITGKQLYSGEGIDTAAWKAKLGVGAGGVDLSVYAKRNASNLTASDISAWQTSLDVTKKADYKDANDIDVSKWKAKLGVGSGGGGGAIDAYTKDEADNKFANKTDLNDYTKKDDYIDANGIDVDKWKAKLGTGAGSADIQNLRNEVYEKIDNVKDEVRDVGSLSAALAGLHPMQYDPKAPAQVMAALGHYKDRQAVAVGASYYFNDRFMMSTGIALSGEKKTKTMANIGFTLKLGKGSGVTYNETPQYVVQNEVKRLTVENQELKSKVNNQDRENQELKERVQKLEEKLNMLLKNK
ncbi:YadA-like family protein [Fusobacterium nucleatum]|uniref:YadA-like family protein n=1 Tax=Fusobacterium nucleatum TaxID=851 RepID=UPI0030CF1059